MNVVVIHADALLSGLAVTLKLCAIIWGLGLSVGPVLGMLAAWGGSLWFYFLRILSIILVGTPIIVLLFWTHYPLQRILGVVWDPFWTAALTLGLMNIVVVGDAVLSGIKSLPKQYELAAQVAGLMRWETLRHIMIPLTLRVVAPTLLLIQVIMLHATLLSSLISVEELFRVAQRINAKEYRPVEIYSAVAIFFWAITVFAYWISVVLRKRIKWTFDDR